MLKLSSPQTNSTASNPYHSPCLAWARQLCKSRSYQDHQALVGSNSIHQGCSERRGPCPSGSGRILSDMLSTSHLEEVALGLRWGHNFFFWLSIYPGLPSRSVREGPAFWKNELDTTKYPLTKEYPSTSMGSLLVLVSPVLCSLLRGGVQRLKSSGRPVCCYQKQMLQSRKSGFEVSSNPSSLYGLANFPKPQLSSWQNGKIRFFPSYGVWGKITKCPTDCKFQSRCQRFS